ncbi:MAG: MarR family transcriptional regulator [Spirochaetia bacterium]|jgi:DNA-binding MarR family transcriptional regulator
MAQEHDFPELDQLFVQLSRLIWSAVREKGLGSLSIIQFYVLMHVSREETRARDLSTDLNVSPAAITKLVDHLVEHGLISRTRSLKDRRSATLKITPAGRAALEKSRRARARMLRMLIDSLSKEEIVVLTRIMRLLVELLPQAWQD